MKILNMLTIAGFAMALVMSCKTTANKAFKDGETQKDTEGWVNDDTYEMVVVGLWDRARYYIEGKDAVDGKEAKSEIGLMQDAKTAAKNVAMRNFKEKMGTYIKSKTGVEDGKLIGDVIQSGLEGVTIAPNAMVENYTDMKDARITYQFSAKGLKATVDSIANQVLKKKNEGM